MNTPHTDQFPGKPDAIVTPARPKYDAHGRLWNPYLNCYELSPEQNVAIINWMVGVQNIGAYLR